MNARSTIAAAVLIAALTAPAAAEARTLPVGSHNGISVKVSKKATVVRFGARAAGLYKTFAGQDVGIGCSTLVESPLGPNVTHSRRATVHSSKRRRPLKAKFAQAHADVCTVTRGRTVRKVKGKTVVTRAKVIARVPLTQLGAMFVSELEAMAPLKVVSQLATRYAQVRGRFPSLGLVNAFGGAPFERYRLVQLNSASGTPGSGTTGYYTNGTAATVVRVASTGRRMFVTVTSDGQLSSNGIVYIAFYT